MKPSDLFPSLIMDDDKITIDRQDLHLPPEFNGANLAYGFVERFYQTQALPISKSNPQGIGRDTIRQNYRIVISLVLDINNIVNEPDVIPPVDPPSPSGGQQLTNELQLMNNLQLLN